jgi:hypothetical protein
MPPLLCGSPCILDQSFPRSTHELETVIDALGAIEECVQENLAHLLLTDTLAELTETFDWNRTKDYPLLIDIYRLLAIWFLQPHERLVRIRTDGVREYVRHPVPEGVDDKGLAEFWAEELGKLLVLHDRCAEDDRYFIGIACERAFAGGEINKYIEPLPTRYFPLVGPGGIGQLSDAFVWEGVPKNAKDRWVSVADARKRLFLLGAKAIESPERGSHYRVTFPGRRSWVLDSNCDPVPDTFLALPRNVA